MLYQFASYPNDHGFKTVIDSIKSRNYFLGPVMGWIGKGTYRIATSGLNHPPKSLCLIKKKILIKGDFIIMGKIMTLRFHGRSATPCSGSKILMFLGPC